jgi:hypothetical protein
VAETERWTVQSPPETAEVPIVPHAHRLARALLLKSVEIPEMTARRGHATIRSKRVAKAVVEAVLVLALLVPWALVFGWLFGPDVFR